MNAASMSVAVLGGSGYVAGELLRLIAGHPHLDLAAVSSDSSSGQAVGSTFPNLADCMGEDRFVKAEALLELASAGKLDGLFCAAPHGAAAALIAEVLAASGDRAPAIVDVSADFRFRSVEQYEAVYGHAHGAPDHLDSFTCAVPEHLAHSPTRHVAHPGCFATAALLAIVPLLAAQVSEQDFFVAGITGSTGSGKSPLPTTHHPERHSNLFAYRPLRHRHAPEIEALAAEATGHHARVHFVPHSGPFARGIHATVQGRLEPGSTLQDLRAAFDEYYRTARFVEIVAGEPRIKDVTGSNRARIGMTCDGRAYVVMSVIDNLVKGAAGGAVQWMNRLLGLDESDGLLAPGPAWI